MSSPMCPACWHERTFRARQEDREPCYDDPPLLQWERPYGGARGQAVYPWDGGVWSCEWCGFRAPPKVAFLLLDAALHLSDPNCDSIGEDGVHADAKAALEGGGK